MRINLHITNGWKKALLPGYDTPNLRLRPLENDDMPFLISMIRENTLYDFVPELDSGKDAMIWLTSVYNKSGYLFYTIKKQRTRDLVGFLMINRNPDQRFSVGGCIALNHWNKGFATDVLKGLAVFLSDTRFKDPVYAQVHHRNIAVQTALKKAGFVKCNPPKTGQMIEYALPAQNLDHDHHRS